MKGGAACWTLPAGYLGSSYIGALLVFAGFDTTASKVASIVIGVVMLFTIWWARRSWLTLLTVLFAIGSESRYCSASDHVRMLWTVLADYFALSCLNFAVTVLVAFWFIDHARPLRFYVLFVGTMSAMYALYDIMDGEPLPDYSLTTQKPMLI